MSRQLLFFGFLFWLVPACDQVAARAPAAPAPTAVPPSTSPPGDLALERLDTRVPVPLLPHMALHQKQNMREHLIAVQEIALAASRSDFAAVEETSRQLGLSPGMERMCQHMGAGAPGFTEQALAFHRSAGAIAAAARSHDSRAVMKALGATLHLCTGCHATFRQKVVDETTWAGLTAPADRRAPPPSAPAPYTEMP
jgi:hypothetical protein